MSAPSDRELVLRSGAGDREAFALLVDRYHRLVFGVAVAITRDRATAEDVGQDTFVAAWRGLGGLGDRSAPAPWLAGIARNLANNTMRKHARRAQLSPTSAPIPSSTPLDSTLDREREQLLRATLDELPDAQREALVLYYLEDRSVEQVASGLGVTTDVVKQRLHRARVAMRERLTERFEPAVKAWRPNAAFTGSVVALIATTSVTKATAATTTATMMTKIAAGASVLVAGTAVFYFVHTRTESSAASIGGAEASPPSVARSTPPSATAADVPTSARGNNAPPVLARVGNAAEHARIADAIATSRQRRTSTGAPADGSAKCPDGSMDCRTNYMRDATVAIMPLLKECVENRMGQHWDSANDGTVRIRSTIETEPDVGAIVSSASIVEDGTTIADPEIRECVRETMYAIELDPAAMAGKLTFETAIRFADDAPPEK